MIFLKPPDGGFFWFGSMLKEIQPLLGLGILEDAFITAPPGFTRGKYHFVDSIPSGF
jgi:hypothetical protein